jgi:hypothetical protein
MKYRMARLGITIAVLLGGVVTLSSTGITSASAATCSGHGCDYQDPTATGCSSGAYTVTSAPVTYNGIQYGTVELRWSPTCQTNWSRLTISAGGSNAQHYDRQVWVARQSDDAQVGFDWTSDGSPIYGDMLYAPGCAEAWGTIQIGSNVIAYGIAVQPGCSLF